MIGDTSYDLLQRLDGFMVDGVDGGFGKRWVYSVGASDLCSYLQYLIISIWGARLQVGVYWVTAMGIVDLHS